MDTCKYWADRFGVDGFRFGQVSGYHNRNLPSEGAPAMIAELRAYAASRGLAERFPVILEETPAPRSPTAENPASTSCRC